MHTIFMYVSTKYMKIQANFDSYSTTNALTIKAGGILLGSPPVHFSSSLFSVLPVYNTVPSGTYFHQTSYLALSAINAGLMA